MAPVPDKTRRWILVKKPGDEKVTAEHFRLDSTPLPSQPDEGKILVKILYYSNDPAQRTWMDSGCMNERPYLPPVMREGEIVCSGAVGEVVGTASPGFAEGDVVFGYFGWTEYAHVDPGEMLGVQKIPQGISPEDYLCMELTGQTAYFSFFDRGKASADLKTVVVNNAAGGVGIMLVQFAKKVLGVANVVAVCGSEAKCKLLVDECGADVALNYKDDDFEVKFEKATPDYIDLYMDGVGGRLFDLGLQRIAMNGTIVVVGAVSQYQRDETVVASNKSWSQMWCQRANVLGFMVLDYPENAKAMEQMVKWTQEGKLKLHNTVYDASLEGVPDVWRGLFEAGTDTVGKRITRLKW